jgi:hypothetical protein
MWKPSALLIIALWLTLCLVGCAAGSTSAHSTEHHRHSASESAPDNTPTADPAPKATPTPSQPTFTYAPASVSPACEADFKAASAAAATDVGQLPAPEDVPLKATANDCLSLDEWVTAAAAYPGALGNPIGGLPKAGLSQNDVIANDLSEICSSAASTSPTLPPLCAEAQADGLKRW